MRALRVPPLPPCSHARSARESGAAEARPVQGARAVQGTQASSGPLSLAAAVDDASGACGGPRCPILHWLRPWTTPRGLPRWPMMPEPPSGPRSLAVAVDGAPRTTRAVQGVQAVRAVQVVRAGCRPGAAGSLHGPEAPQRVVPVHLLGCGVQKQSACAPKFSDRA